MAFHERKYAGLLLRLTGTILLVLAFLVGRHLFGRADLTARTRPSAYLLAFVFITSLSPGAAMAALGRHLLVKRAGPPRSFVGSGNVPPPRQGRDTLWLPASHPCSC